MKTLYLECNMGAAGDMLMAALSELTGDCDASVERLNGMNIPNVTYVKRADVKCGITGTHIDVLIGGEREDEHMNEHNHEHEDGHTHEHHHHEQEHTHEHHHSSMHDIEHIIDGLNASERVRENAKAVYNLIAEAESHAHGRSISEIHFHEVGTMDAVADVMGVCMLMEEIGAEKIIVSPVNVGSGQVKCAHGILPVPAPATAHILRDVPIYSGKVNGELCTPTGAALLKHFADDFAEMPVMTVSKIGCGTGTKDFEAANCVRAFLGETQDESDMVCELCCNIDDMTGEQIGFAADILFENGALDVYTAPIYMKKNRPALLLTCMCRKEKKEDMLRLILKHTTTIGVREYVSKRYVLKRTLKTAHTDYGDITVKESEGYGVKKVKAEYDELAKIARDNNIALSDIKIEY